MKKTLILSITVLSLALASTVMATDMAVVSDATTQWSADNVTYQPTVATWVHPSWPSIPGATWIWRTTTNDPVAEYANVPDGGWYFKKTFEVPQCAEDITATISIDSDNAEALYFNGNLIGQDGALNKNGPDTYSWSTIKTYSVNPVVGENTILVRVINYFNYGTYNSNPAGLTFKLTMNYGGGDSDGDGVCDAQDKCEGTTADSILNDLGTNRWIWNGSAWQTLKPKGRGPAFTPTLDYTYGCSCTQILDAIKDTTGSELLGHYKFGCSQSILQDWNAGY